MEQAPIPTVFEIQSLLFFEVTIMWNQSHDCLILQKARWTYLSMTVWISNQPFVKTGTKQISGYQFVSNNQDLYPNHLRYNSILVPEKQDFMKANFLDPFSNSHLSTRGFTSHPVIPWGSNETWSWGHGTLLGSRKMPGCFCLWR